MDKLTAEQMEYWDGKPIGTLHKQKEPNMTNTKHTPGPWKWVKARTMAHLHGPNGYFGISMSLKSLSEKDKANYELFAAAPELLESCKALLNLLRNGDDGHGEGAGIVALADARVRKAEGEK